MIETRWMKDDLRIGYLVMPVLPLLLAGVFLFACGDDNKPTAPGDELVGSWDMIFSSDPEEL